MFQIHIKTVDALWINRLYSLVFKPLNPFYPFMTSMKGDTGV